MKSTPPQILSGGLLALALATAVTAGAALATTDTTEPTGDSAAPGELAPGCAEIVGLLSAQFGVATAYLSEDGAALGALFAALPGQAAAAQATAPADVADAVTAWVEPLTEIQTILAGVDLGDFEAVTATLSSIPPNDAADAAQADVESWATENCGWSNEFDPFADAPEPPECDVLDAAVVVESADIEVDITDTDGQGDISLPGYWQKSCSYGNGALTLSTISFNDLDAATQFFADNLVDSEGNPGEFIVVDLGGLPASTIVTNVDGSTSVTVLEATIPFSVSMSGDIDPVVVVAAAQAIFGTLPTEAPPPPTTEPMTEGSAAPATTAG